MKHNLTIVSLHDAQLVCDCGWSLIFTGAMKRAEAIKEHNKHLYSEFALEWRKTHVISPPPSFTSWYQSYRV